MSYIYNFLMSSDIMRNSQLSQSCKSSRALQPGFGPMFDKCFGPKSGPKFGAFKSTIIFFQSQVAVNFEFSNATTNRTKNDEFACMNIMYFPSCIAIFGYEDFKFYLKHPLTFGLFSGLFSGLKSNSGSGLKSRHVYKVNSELSSAGNTASRLSADFG